MLAQDNRAEFNRHCRHKMNMWAPYFICANDERDFKEWLTVLISVVSRSNPADDFEYSLDKFIAQWYVYNELYVKDSSEKIFQVRFWIRSWDRGANNLPDVQYYLSNNNYYT
jgi:hypothetical protein